MSTFGLTQRAMRVAGRARRIVARAARCTGLVLSAVALVGCYVELRTVPASTGSGAPVIQVGPPIGSPLPTPCPNVQPLNGREVSGAFVVIGEARCAGGVLLRVFDASGQRIGTLATSTTTNRVGADGTAPFAAVYPNPPATVGSFTVEVTPRSDAPPTSRATCALAGDLTRQLRGVTLTLAGTITCTGSAEATFVRVAAIFYDAAPQPIGVSADYFMQGHVAPGASAAFSIRFGDETLPGASAASYRLFVDWR